jgi:hypothetical protein
MLSAVAPITNFRNCGMIGTSISLEISVKKLTSPSVNTVLLIPRILRPLSMTPPHMIKSKGEAFAHGSKSLAANASPLRVL